MNKYSITSYEQAEDRIRTYGYIWDVGQIHPNVLAQLFRGVQLGLIKTSFDGWPLRYAGGEQKRLFEFIKHETPSNQNP